MGLLKLLVASLLSITTVNSDIQGNIISKLYSANKTIKLIWIPSHYGIYSEEEADILAGSNVDLDLYVSLIKLRIHLLCQTQCTRLDIRNKI